MCITSLGGASGRGLGIPAHPVGAEFRSAKSPLYKIDEVERANLPCDIVKVGHSPVFWATRLLATSPWRETSILLESTLPYSGTTVLACISSITLLGQYACV